MSQSICEQLLKERLVVVNDSIKNRRGSVAVVERLWFLDKKVMILCTFFTRHLK